MLATLELFDFVVIGILMIVIAGVLSYGRRPASDARLRRIDRKLDVLLEQMGIELDETALSGLSPEVQRLAESGKKIEAIKLHREETGVGLKEAKDAVDSYLAR